MKKELVIGIVIVLAVAVIVVVSMNSTQTTGQAAFTPGANYGPIGQNFNVYTQCSYVTTDDGWDVTRQTTVKYYNKLEGAMEEYSDQCSGAESISELHCEDGYRKARLVNCPSGTACKSGACVAE